MLVAIKRKRAMNLLEQIEASIGTRQFEERDYDAVVAISNAVVPDRPWTVDELRYEDDHLDRGKYVLERHVAVDRRTGVPAGYGEVRHLPWNFHPRKFGMTIRVFPDLWGRGIGSRPWDRLQQSLRAREAVGGRRLVKGGRAHAVGFGQARGVDEGTSTGDSL